MIRFLVLSCAVLLASSNIQFFSSSLYSFSKSVAYAAAYETNYTSEPLHEKQTSLTYKYLNLDDTLTEYRGDAVKVGIIDSGINYDHEDFLKDGKTIVKDESKYYKYNSTSSKWEYYSPSTTASRISYLDDTFGHGTNVAATVAAQINNIGGYGIAPNVELYVYKVTNTNNGYEWGAIQNALLDAISLKLDVVNMSFQSYTQKVTYGSSSMSASSGCSTVLSSYLTKAYNAGITLVAAAGNFNTSTLSYPASNEHVISVGSCDVDNDQNFVKAAYSNYGSKIDLVAPGTVYVASKDSSSAYKQTQGTSFSAPLVTGAIALYKQKHPNATPDEIEQALYDSCFEIDDSSSQYANWAGHGALNVYDFVYGTSVSIETVPSIISVSHNAQFKSNRSYDVNWSLSDSSFGSIDNNGNFTPLKEGNVTVIVDDPIDGTTDSVEINIIPEIVGLESNPSSINLVVEEDYYLDINYVLSNGGRHKASFADLTMTLQSEDFCLLDDNNGYLSALGVGNTTILITDKFNHNLEIPVNAVEKIVDVTGIKLDKNEALIKIGEIVSLNATIEPENATNKNIIWSSEDETIATVNNGLVTGKNEGTTKIFAKSSGGKIATECVVTVTKDAEISTNGYWKLVTQVTELHDLDEIVIGSKNNNALMGKISGNFSSSIEQTFNEDRTDELNSDSLIFELHKDNDSWQLLSKSDNKYLTSTAQKNISLSTSTSFGWNITIDNGDATITYYKTSYGRILYNVVSPRFTTYTSALSKTMVLPQIYRYVMTANEWATYFVGEINCDITGKNAPSIAGWNNANKKFISLDDNYKNIIKNATAIQGENDIENAVYFYDYILNKYGTSNYSNFIERDIVNKSSIFKVTENDNYVALIVIVSLISISTITFLVFIKNKKEKENA